MTKYLKIFSPLVLLFTLSILLVFKTIPTGKLWKNYTVLYVPANTDNQKILSVLNDSHILGVVALSQQYLPVNLPENSVEISMFKINRDNPEYSYYKNRNSYFFDKSKNNRLYYIPAEYKTELSECTQTLHSAGIDFGIDSVSQYPWIIPLAFAVLILILSLFSKNKLLFSSSSLINVLYIYGNPFYNGAFSCILIILLLFFVSNIWRRKLFFSTLMNNYLVLILLFISVTGSFSTSIRNGLFFVVMLFSISSYIVSFYFLENFVRNRKTFNPVLIHSANKVSLFAKKSNIVMISFIITSIILLASFVFSSSHSFSTNNSKILFPSPAKIQSEELPQLDDYYAWLWKIKAYPYQSLNKNLSDYIIDYPEYVNENGFISEVKSVLSYEQSFKDNSRLEIEQLPFESIEKVLVSEGENITTGYTSSANCKVSVFGVIMMIICVFVLLFIYFYIIIKKVN